MPYSEETYQHTPEQLAEMRDLIVQSVAADRKPFNQRVSMFENWAYTSRYDYPLEYFTSRVHLWRDDRGRLAAYLLRYYTTTYLQVRPGCRDLEDAMLAWAEQHWYAENGFVRTHAGGWDNRRQELLVQRGYSDQGCMEIVRLYDLRRQRPAPCLPEGFTFSTVEQTGDSAGRIALENATWGRTDMDEDWFRGKSSSPDYSLDWDLLALSPQDQAVGFSLVWIDSTSATAEIDPLGVHPAFRQRGLARALVFESMRRLHARGIDWLYIASEAGEAAPNRLYASLEPDETYDVHGWKLGG